MSEAESIAVSRRESWRAIHATLSDALPDPEKLRRCLNIADVHAAMTGDDSLVPPQIRDEREKMIEWVKESSDKIKKARANREFNEKHGIVDLFEAL
jgi:hypothetical protein